MNSNNLIVKSKRNQEELASVIEMPGALRDFILPIVEFLGILVPGMFFIFALIPAIVIPTVTMVRIFEGVQNTAPIASEYLAGIVLSPSAGTIFLLAIFSYVFGHMFFRQDPKVPDNESFKKVNVAELMKEEGPVRLCDAEIAYNKEMNKGKKPEHQIPPMAHNMEFPYRYLYEYLSDRGMSHLAEMVQWKGADPTSYQKRTKHFMNVIKVRLEFLLPYQYIRLQRNEAHVRLMSSMWYASRSLIVVSIVGAMIGGACILMQAWLSGYVWPIPYIGSVVVPLAVLTLAVYFKEKVESFLHYQRIREIVFILEAAYVAKKLFPDFDFYEKSQEDKSVAQFRGQYPY